MQEEKASRSGAPRVAVIGGDGIGPEVCAEALKVVRRRRRGPRHHRVRPRGGPLSAHGEVLPDECSRSSGLRRHPARRCRPAGRGHLGAAGDAGAGAAAPDPLRARPLRQPAALHRRPRVDRRRCGLRGGAGEHRGHLRRRGGFLRKGTPHEVATQGSVNTRMGAERCVRFAFELAGRPHAS